LVVPTSPARLSRCFICAHSKLERSNHSGQLDQFGIAACNRTGGEDGEKCAPDHVVPVATVTGEPVPGRSQTLRNDPVAGPSRAMATISTGMVEK
jgi:hypothetical protein